MRSRPPAFAAMTAFTEPSASLVYSVSACAGETEWAGERALARSRNGEPARRGARRAPSGVSSARDGWEERNLAAMAGYVANQIRTDPSETYGNGLRVALGAYQRVGLRAVFDRVRATGEIPT